MQNCCEIAELWPFLHFCDMQQTQSAPSWIDGPFRYCKQSQCVCACKYKQKEVLHYLFGAKLTTIGRFLIVGCLWQPSLTPSWISQNAQWCQLGIMQILILHIFPYHNQQTRALSARLYSRCICALSTILDPYHTHIKWSSGWEFTCPAWDVTFSTSFPLVLISLHIKISASPIYISTSPI